MTQLNEKQVKMITKTIMPFLYLIQEQQDQYEVRHAVNDQSEKQQMYGQASEKATDNEELPLS